MILSRMIKLSFPSKSAKRGDYLMVVSPIYLKFLDVISANSY